MLCLQVKGGGRLFSVGSEAYAKGRHYLNKLIEFSRDWYRTVSIAETEEVVQTKTQLLNIWHLKAQVEIEVYQLTVNRKRLEAKVFLDIKAEHFQSKLPKLYREKKKNPTKQPT